MNHSSNDRHQASLPAVHEQPGAMTAIQAVMVPVFAAWASAF